MNWKHAILFAGLLLTGRTGSGQDSTSFSDWIADIPKKWKDESVVILNYQHEYYIKLRYYEKSEFKETVKLVYYIRDKWGVEELSQLTLPSKLKDQDWSNNIGTVHKPNGTSFPITRDMLIQQKKKIDFSGFRRSRALQLDADDHAKLAVPSLGVGDVLELGYTHTEAEIPDIVYLVNTFPMLHFATTVTVDPYSGGPQSMQVRPYYMNFPSLSNSLSAQFEVKLDSVDKYKEEILSDNVRRLPYVLLRYQIIPEPVVKNDYSSTSFNNTYNSQQLQLYLARVIYNKIDEGEKSLSGNISGILKKKYPVIKDTAAFVRDAYYLYREIRAREHLFADNQYRSSRHFACAISRVLFDRKIRHQAFLSQPDFLGMPESYKEFLDPEFGIYVHGLNLYLFDPLLVLEPGAIPSYYEEHDHIRFSINKHYKRVQYFWWLWCYPPLGVVTLPLTLPPYIVQNSRADKYRVFDLEKNRFPAHEPTRNQIRYEIRIKELDPSGHTITFDQQAFYYGKHKSLVSRRVVNIRQGLMTQNNPYKKMLKFIEAPRADKKTEEDEQKLQEKRLKDLVRAELRSDGFFVKDVRNYEITAPNLFDPELPFTHRFEFTARNMVWSFQDYMIISAGSIIGDQLSVPEDEVERSKDFYIPYKQQFSYVIRIPVPAGYEPTNLQEFNLKGESEAGSFVSTAQLEGNEIVITTLKIYKFHTYPKENAGDVYLFVNEAEKFYNKKLILRKKT